ncbi:MAG TPA: hypothetical protein VF719_00665 [Abditibacteriaceae bacterium]
MRDPSTASFVITGLLMLCACLYPCMVLYRILVAVGEASWKSRDGALGCLAVCLIALPIAVREQLRDWLPRNRALAKQAKIDFEKLQNRENFLQEVQEVLDGLRILDPKRSDTFLHDFLEKVQAQGRSEEKITVRTNGLGLAMHHGCSVSDTPTEYRINRIAAAIEKFHS